MPLNTVGAFANRNLVLLHATSKDANATAPRRLAVRKINRTRRSEPRGASLGTHYAPARGGAQACARDLTDARLAIQSARQVPAPHSPRRRDIDRLTCRALSVLGRLLRSQSL